ncbi:hypothetical protein [Pseudonocardia sp. TRM90224]|uniref:hypothetical protein n=1 Tax=Pseudonocardia sp. TRM90224 TaxID=2812678 RepID=UPI001E5670B1|nr:hypothetical protein [Pseudonocardia sp. TRM90224]
MAGRPAVLPAVVTAVLAAAALLVAGCTSSVSGTPETTGGAPATSAQRTTSNAAPGKKCTVSVGSGVISMSGNGGRASTKNGQSSFSCGNGPLIAVGPIDANGVTLTVDSTPVPIAVGSSATVGPYDVSLQSIENGVAKLTVAT